MPINISASIAAPIPEGHLNAAGNNHESTNKSGLSSEIPSTSELDSKTSTDTSSSSESSAEGTAHAVKLPTTYVQSSAINQNLIRGLHEIQLTQKATAKNNHAVEMNETAQANKRNARFATEEQKNHGQGATEKQPYDNERRAASAA